VGFVINFQSDTILMRLRKPGETGHKLPRGGLFRWVSSPNYFGELVEWSGGRSQPGRWLAWPLRFGERLTLCRVHWRIIVGVARNSQTIYVNGGL
jgi:hypothetical protein